MEVWYLIEKKAYNMQHTNAKMMEHMPHQRAKKKVIPGRSVLLNRLIHVSIILFWIMHPTTLPLVGCVIQKRFILLHFSVRLLSKVEHLQKYVFLERYMFCYTKVLFIINNYFFEYYCTIYAQFS